MTTEQQIQKADSNGMTKGIAYCIAVHLKYWGEHPWIDEVWRAAGMTMEECRQIVDEYDLETLEQYAEYLDKLSSIE